MSKTRAPYPLQYRQKIIELGQAGRSVEELARLFEPTEQTIRKWLAQADRDAGKRSDGLSSPEREELNRLRREVRRLKLEREILSQAAVWFARKTGTIPDKGSN
jgi:transposase